MEALKRTITLHMVASVDGMIAKKDQSIRWFETTDTFERGEESEDVEAFLKTIDCYIMGSRTYELAVELSKEHGWAYGDTPTVVLTHRHLSANRKNIQFYGGDLKQLIYHELPATYQNIWVVGGAEVAREFIEQQLVDEIRISILPIILGDGIPYFKQMGNETALHVKDLKAYKNGMVELCYEIKK